MPDLRTLRLARAQRHVDIQSLSEGMMRYPHLSIHRTEGSCDMESTPSTDNIQELVRLVIDPGAIFSDDTLTIHRWEGDELDPPVVIHLSVHELGRRMMIDEESRLALWPDRSAEVAGLFLFMSNLSEVLNGRRSNPRLNHVVKDARGSLILSASELPGAIPDRAVHATGIPGRWRAYAPLTGETLEASSSPEEDRLTDD